MNIEAFYSDIETMDFTGTSVGILETPFLECYDFPELSSILEMYYSGNFSQAFEVTNALVKMIPSDACLYNLAGSALFQQGQHVKAHDFFKNACQRQGYQIEWPCFCTLKLSRQLLPDLESKNLDTLAKHFELSFIARHRSIGDCEVTGTVLHRLLDEEGAHLKQWKDMQPFQVS